MAVRVPSATWLAASVCETYATPETRTRPSPCVRWPSATRSLSALFHHATLCRTTHLNNNRMANPPTVRSTTVPMTNGSRGAGGRRSPHEVKAKTIGRGLEILRVRRYPMLSPPLPSGLKVWRLTDAKRHLISVVRHASVDAWPWIIRGAGR